MTPEQKTKALEKIILDFITNINDFDDRIKIANINLYGIPIHQYKLDQHFENVLNHFYKYEQINILNVPIFLKSNIVIKTKDNGKAFLGTQPFIIASNATKLIEPLSTDPAPTDYKMD